MPNPLDRFKVLGWRQWLVIAAFFLVLAITGLHAFRAVRNAAYWSHHRDEAIHGWMSVGYIARSYHVPPRVLYDALGLQRTPHDRKPIRQIAREQNRPVHEVVAILQEAIVRTRQSGIPPPSLGLADPPDKGRSP